MKCAMCGKNHAIGVVTVWNGFLRLAWVEVCGRQKCRSNAKDALATVPEADDIPRFTQWVTA